MGSMENSDAKARPVDCHSKQNLINLRKWKLQLLIVAKENPEERSLSKKLDMSDADFSRGEKKAQLNQVDGDCKVPVKAETVAASRESKPRAEAYTARPNFKKRKYSWLLWSAAVLLFLLAAEGVHHYQASQPQSSAHSIVNHP